MAICLTEKDAVWICNRLYDFSQWVGVPTSKGKKLFKMARKLNWKIIEERSAIAQKKARKRNRR